MIFLYYFRFTVQINNFFFSHQLFLTFFKKKDALQKKAPLVKCNHDFKMPSVLNSIKEDQAFFKGGVNIPE